MIQYIYFVKCPNCEDEPFDFFDEAKAFALGCLGSKPIITQTEVCRNDFGECTDSSDLGTVWSWEDEARVTEDEPAISVFTKGDFAKYNPEHDAEFDALDNSLDFEPADGTEFHSDVSLDKAPDNFRKPVPADMTVEALVEEMEENEDMVECKCCSELFDKSEAHYEVDLGYLCSQCEAAIKSRGETLTFKENFGRDPLDHHDPDYNEEDAIDYLADQADLADDRDFNIAVDSLKEASTVSDWHRLPDYELYYDDLEIVMYDGNDTEVTVDEYIYKVDPVDVIDAITMMECLVEEDVADFPGGLEAWYIAEDDAVFNDWVLKHFISLADKYDDKLKEHFRDRAQEEAEIYFNENPDKLADYEAPDSGYGRGAFNSESDFWNYKEGDYHHRY